MIPPPVAPPEMTRTDVSQLDSLSTAFKIVGVLTILLGSIFWFHEFIGFSLIGGSNTFSSSSKGAPPPFFGGLFAGVGLGAIAYFYTMGVLAWKTAGWLDERIKYGWCFGVSIALLLIQPLGTILGIFAIIVLNRTQVKSAFKG